jgi:hypothetical protein
MACLHFRLMTVIEGWLDKPKGLKQVLWERGLIDLKKPSSYSKEGPSPTTENYVSK